MPNLEKTYRLFIASPGDVHAERDLIEELVLTINNEHRNVSLAPVRWEHDTPDLNTDDTQARINKDLDKCDAMVAIFGDKLGTPTARAIGGAVEEVRDFTGPIMLYLKRSNEESLKEELSRFIPNVENRTWRTYSDIDDLEEQASSDIRRWFNSISAPLATETPTPYKRLFIEEQFPVEEIGIESVREGAPIPGQFPKLKTLHVWWARRPLVASAATILASVLPAWNAELSDNFPGHRALSTAHSYRAWFLRMCGVLGDPIEAKRKQQVAKETGIRSKGDLYGYKPAFKNKPSPDDINLLHLLLNDTWSEIPKVLDPTAGGGSIPFQALRYRLPSTANDLNPIAAAILRASLEVPALYQTGLLAELVDWGEILASKVESRLAPYFPSLSPNEQPENYLFARTVSCPRTGQPVPLVGDWWLRKGSNPVAVRLVTDIGVSNGEPPQFEVVHGGDIDFDPKACATWDRGKAVSPWDGQVIDSAYIKAEAQAGRMGEVLYAVRISQLDKRGYEYRPPHPTDLDALVEAATEFARLAPEWQDADILPNEDVPYGNDNRPHSYGMPRWLDMFSARQLLTHGCFVDEYRKLTKDIRSHYHNDDDRGKAILALLGIAQGKALNYNSRLSSWDCSRNRTRPVFDRHDFSFKNTFAERTNLYSWCLTEEMPGIYGELSNLLQASEKAHEASLSHISIPEPSVSILCRDAGDLRTIPDASQTLVCIDPPYYDNVMYAELSDYFYVWEKRVLNCVWPELFEDELTDKTREAVKNDARFVASGKSAQELADNDYHLKMASIFRECHRVLVPDGVLTVMFTHKRTEAWDALGTALLDAGFTIGTSWPVRTEPDKSLHQAKSNSAESTVLLTCRKRIVDESDNLHNLVYFNEIEGRVRLAAREAFDRSFSQNLRGVDLLLSTYGPVLSELSQCWPVLSDEADEDGRSRKLQPAEALGVARREVTRLLKAGLLAGRDSTFDAVTDFVVLAWEIFKAQKAPFDEVRRLALAVGGLDLDHLARGKILTKAGGMVKLSEPRERLRENHGERSLGVNRDRTRFESVIDSVHTALYIVGEDGPGSAKRWIDERGLAQDQRFLDCLQALVNAVPRSKSKGEWNVAEAGLLDRLVTTYFSTDIDLPPDPLEAVQGTLNDG